MRRHLALLAVAAALSGGGPALALEPEDLPEGPGREETFYTCSACHSFELVAKQRLPRERWEELIDWMIAKQGMDPPDPDTRALIVGYLAVHFGPERRPRAPAAPLRVEEVEDLPDTLGREEAFYTCSACHSFTLVAQQGLSRGRWDALIDWMVEEQGMDEPDPETRERILGYLVRWFGPDRAFASGRY